MKLEEEESGRLIVTFLTFFFSGVLPCSTATILHGCAILADPSVRRRRRHRSASTCRSSKSLFEKLSIMRLRSKLY